jgi:hypothetical protein
MCRNKENYRDNGVFIQITIVISNPTILLFPSHPLPIHFFFPIHILCVIHDNFLLAGGEKTVILILSTRAVWNPITSVLNNWPLRAATDCAHLHGDGLVVVAEEVAVLLIAPIGAVLPAVAYLSCINAGQVPAHPL